MSENLPEIKIDTIVDLMKNNVPWMEEVSRKATSVLQSITEIPDDDYYEYVEGTLANVREAYNALKARRTMITSPLDQLKVRMMDFERPLSDTDKTNEYNRLRNLLGAYKQAKIEKQKAIEQAAAKKKERENHLVDVGAQILTNLNDLLLSETKAADELSDAYFKKSTLEDWDKRADVYNKMRPSLKPEKYQGCFSYKIERRFDLWTEEEWVDILHTIKGVETLAKWTELLIQSATPVINAWKAKMPELKQNLINLKNASDESERQRIATEQAAKAAQEKERRDRELEQQHLDKGADISAQANLSKLENSFVEQATVQSNGDTGPTKLVLKFTDPKKTLKALSTIMYHVMAHPEFPGINKKDKNKQVVLDETGKPEYIEAVQWWINFFLAKCDADIDGTEVIEKAKTIIRK